MYIISGPNGAGKTTLSFSILPEMFECREFINADEIARGLSPLNPQKARIEAGRIMLRKIDDLMKAQEQFAFETTLASKGYLRLIKKAKQSGYSVTLLFLLLESVDLAIERVRIRVEEGGHDVEKKDIIRRFERGLRNFFNYYRFQTDRWILVENSSEKATLIGEGSKNHTIIHQKKLWHELSKRYGQDK